jgi:hypothetical protein
MFLDVDNDPVDEVILESSLDELMKYIRRDHLVDVRPRKIICEWLANKKIKGIRLRQHGHEGSLELSVRTISPSSIP